MPIILRLAHAYCEFSTPILSYCHANSDESTSTLSLLLDELLSPSYSPDFPIPSRVELLDRRSTIKHREPTSKPYGLLVIEDENLSFVPKIPQSNRLIERLNRDVVVKTCVEKTVKNEELLKKWKIKYHQVKQRSKRSLYRSQKRNLDTKEITYAAVDHNREASFLEWLMAEQKRNDDVDTIVTPQIDNTSTRSLANVDPDDMNLVIRSLSPLDKSPTSLKSLEAFLWEIQRDRLTIGKASLLVIAGDIDSTISDITSVTAVLPEHQTLNLLPLIRTDAKVQSTRSVSETKPEHQTRSCISTLSTPTTLTPTITPTQIGRAHV